MFAHLRPGRPIAKGGPNDFWKCEECAEEQQRREAEEPPEVKRRFQGGRNASAVKDGCGSKLRNKQLPLEGMSTHRIWGFSRHRAERKHGLDDAWLLVHLRNSVGGNWSPCSRILQPPKT